MAHELCTATEAARRLGVTRTTLYDWLGQSDRGLLVIRGRSVTISYFQGGAQGQGRIMLEAPEVDRIRELMRVQPTYRRKSTAIARPAKFPGITVALGRPEQ